MPFGFGKKKGALPAPGKAFRLTAEQIRPIAPGFGGCFASDRITVHGDRVGWMYREPPDIPEDSGWRFFSGTETDEFANDPKNMAFYDVNTIANYDPEIVPFLASATGSAFARDPLSGPLRHADPA